LSCGAKPKAAGDKNAFFIQRLKAGVEIPLL
jgi:hypothetical protein